ncbi:hypothetical protein [Flagellimonas ruestringensis]|nr:hypothetical protein [Allomuricauda ruestringensis]
MKKGKTAMKILGTSSLGMGLVIVLFLSSERQVHRNNAFTRRIPPHAITKKFDLDLGFNSYYIAGYDNNNMYLGNGTAPFHVLQIDLKSLDTSHIRLYVNNSGLQFRNVQISVLQPYFFLFDGTVPIVLRGDLGDWSIQDSIMSPVFFDKAIPVGKTDLVCRTFDTNSQAITLGSFHFDTNALANLKPEILEKQIDGVFDVDGAMTSTPDHSLLLYSYYYRNEFIVLDSHLNIIKRQNTLDTVTTAQIEVTSLKEGQISEMLAPPVIINNSSSLEGSRAYIISNRLGKYENMDILNQASILDVYDWKKGTYEFSTYIHKTEREKIREIKVVDNLLYALVGNRLSVYELRH